MKYLIAASIILVSTAILFLIFAPRLFSENESEFLTSEQILKKCYQQFLQSPANNITVKRNYNKNFQNSSICRELKKKEECLQNLDKKYLTADNFIKAIGPRGNAIFLYREYLIDYKCKHAFKQTRDEIMCENDAAFIQGCPHINLIAVNSFIDCVIIEEELECKKNSLNISCSNKAFIEYEDKKERYAIQKALPICKFNFSIV